MFTSVRLAGVVFLLLLVSATASFSQQPDSAAAAHSGARPGRGAIGSQLGGAYILSGGDYATNAQPRFSFEGSFRYVITSGWRWQVSPYFAWNAYTSDLDHRIQDKNYIAYPIKDIVLTQIVGANGQVQRTGTMGLWKWHIGAGPAIYRVVVQNHRRTVKDPLTNANHQGTYLGATVEYGFERFLRSQPNVSLEWTAAYQTAFAKDDARFPSGFNGAPGAAEIRFGGHYYFDFKAPKKPGGIPARAH
jgi:hypothetical protein